MFPTQFLWMFPLGAAVGFFGGLFGIGGGVIAVPLFALAFGMDQALAQGTALVMMVPNLIVAWWRYQQRHPVPWRHVFAIALLASLTTAISAHFAARLDPLLLRALFGAFMFLLALSMCRRPPVGSDPTCRNADPRQARLPGSLLPCVGVVGGSSMGLLGIGGGLLATPLFVRLFGQRQTVAQSLALALVTPSSVVALASYAQAHKVDWQIGLPLAVGGLFTVSAGVALAHRLPERRMQQLFAMLLFASALPMLPWRLIG
ncbi:sulfite exporter TauE/SafE family protein [Methyloversatilis thermotolerans]|uniref:sulfite exporter TauE/SafE family protein n=1 Tax=Methyloversatilis thermotolerans TaxID=1346290 RepID=UPI00035E82BA|nr:sulfite exporter TauE/SafE family protein [Methyloversatilis thermotolerans]